MNQCHFKLDEQLFIKSTFWSSQYLKNTQIIPSVSTYQYGVPTKELAGEAMEAEPKSASLTSPGSVSRILPAFTSLRARGTSVFERYVGDVVFTEASY